MDIILLQDVKKIGKKGERVKVSDGYARNYLIPKGLGAEPNAAVLNDVKLRDANLKKVAAEELAAAQELAGKIAASPVTLSVKSGTSGKVFGSVTSKEIAKAFADAYGVELDKKKIVLPEAIKDLGDYELPVKLHKDVTAKLQVKGVAKE